MKKLLPLASLILLADFASAQFYGRFSLGDFLYAIDASTAVLGATFIISFLFINFALSKYFGGNKTLSGVAAGAISFLIIWFLNTSSFVYNFIYQGFFYFLGLPQGFIETFWPVMLIVIFISLCIWKGLWKGLSLSLVIYGGFFTLAGVFFIEGGGAALMVFGIALIAIGAAIWAKKTKKKSTLEKLAEAN